MNTAFLKYSTWLIFLCLSLVYLYEIYVKEADTSHKKSDENADKIVEWAQEYLPHTGILQEDHDGFVYLKVNDDYIDQLYPLITHPHYRKPPYFRRNNAPGAHISVFYANERHRIGTIEEIGKEYPFNIIDLESVPPHSHEFMVLKVNSPELENLRKKYGFKPLLQNHGFHITIAKKRHHSKNMSKKTDKKIHSEK